MKTVLFFGHSQEIQQQWQMPLVRESQKPEKRQK